ncbi:MAG: YqaA family protein [Alphaproteobacteria bacterium]|jgi:membrane protein YqaA with SNARE-associated domain|tara:strand:- start:99 stop:677 length:579 start_codon:yes stop_codon:yes gene_type:complete
MLLKNLYNKILLISAKPKAEIFLGSIAFIESSFFPIPPDLLLLPMALARPLKWIRLAIIATFFSVLGGVFGYFIGVFLWDTIGQSIIDFYHLENQFDVFRNNYNEKGALIVFIAGFTPIPYKLITISSGGMHLDLMTFIVASLLSRGARFFILTGIIRIFGDTAKKIIDKYFGMLTLIIGLIVIIIFSWLYF